MLPSTNGSLEQVDLASFTLGNSSQVYLTYGIDTALGDRAETWAYNVTIGNTTANAPYAWLGWGYDRTLSRECWGETRRG